jgi:hypothetical protein
MERMLSSLGGITGSPSVHPFSKQNSMASTASLNAYDFDVRSDDGIFSLRLYWRKIGHLNMGFAIAEITACHNMHCGRNLDAPEWVYVFPGRNST